MLNLYAGYVRIGDLPSPLKKLTTYYRYPLVGLTIWTTSSQSVEIATNGKPLERTGLNCKSTKTDSHQETTANKSSPDAKR